MKMYHSKELSPTITAKRTPPTPPTNTGIMSMVYPQSGKNFQEQKKQYNEQIKANSQIIKKG